MNGNWYVLHGINPEPWRIGPLSIGRNRTTGRIFPIVGQDAQLASFQQAVKEAVEKTAVNIDGPLELRFYFWRRLDSYEGKRSRITKHAVDATNMQKATEDALQGLVMENDNEVIRIQTTIMAQGTDVEPCIVIFAQLCLAIDTSEIPNEIWSRIAEGPQLFEEEDSNVWPPRS